MLEVVQINKGIVMRLCFAILLSLFMHSTAYADCFADCLFQKGTHCVNGFCVPLTDPTPTPIVTPIPNPPSTVISAIWMDMVQQDKMAAVGVDCTGMDLKNFAVYLVRKTPPPTASYYSAIEVFSLGLQQEVIIHYFFARKDILNRYVLILAEEEPVKPQFIGLDFAFTRWENLAFKEIIGSMSCEELRKSGFFFVSGISVKGDRSDFEGNIFYFK